MLRVCLLLLALFASPLFNLAVKFNDEEIFIVGDLSLSHNVSVSMANVTGPVTNAPLAFLGDEIVIGAQDGVYSFRPSLPSQPTLLMEEEGIFFVSDVRGEQVVAFLNEDGQYLSSPGFLASLSIFDPRNETGKRTIDLSEPLFIGFSSGIFAGIDQVLLSNGADQSFHHIDTRTGQVSPLEAPLDLWFSSDGWVSTGVAEFFTFEDTYLLYPNSLGQVEQQNARTQEVEVVYRNEPIPGLSSVALQPFTGQWAWYSPKDSSLSTEEYIGLADASVIRAWPTSQPSGQPSSQPSSSPTSMPTLTPAAPRILAMTTNASSTGVSIQASLDMNTLYAGTVYCAAFAANTVLTSTTPVVTQGVSIAYAPRTTSVLLSIRGLIPITSYEIYCYVITRQGFASSLEDVLETRTSLTTQCCKSITFTSPPSSVYADLTKYSASQSAQYTFNYQLYASPKKNVTVRPVFTILSTSGSSGSSALTLTASPASLSFTNRTSTSLKGSFLVLASSFSVSATVRISFLLSGPSAAEYSETSYTFSLLSSSSPPAAPVFTNAQFSNQGNSLNLFFDSATDRAGRNIGQTWTCSQVFTFPASSQSTCVWLNASNVEASWPSSVAESLLPIVGDKVVLAASTVRAACTGDASSCASYPFAAGANVSIVGPSVTILPTAVLSLPTTLGGCDDLVLNPSLSTGRAGRNWTRVVWSISIQSSTPVDTTPLYTLLNSYGVRIQRRITIPRSGLTTGRYSFGLTVTNFFGTSASTTGIVDVTGDTSQPLLTILGSNSITTTAAQSLSIYASAKFSACASGSSVRLGYSWSVRNRATNELLPAVVSGSNDPTIFTLSPFVLSAGQVYLVQANCTAFVNGQASSTPASAAVQVTVQSGKVWAIVNGGETRQLGLDFNLTLDASASYDEDSATTEGLSYMWSCTHVSLSLYGQSCTEQLQLPTSDDRVEILIRGDTLREEELYEISLIVEAADGRWDETLVRLEPLPAGSPYLELLLTSSQKFNVDQNLSLAGLLQSFDTTNTYWEVLVGGEFVNVTTFSSIFREFSVEMASASALTSVLIAANSFVGGSYVTFRLTAVTLIAQESRIPNSQRLSSDSPALGLSSLRSTTSQSALHPMESVQLVTYSEITLVANVPPTGGSLTVDPKTGLGLETVFTMSSDNWEDDPADYPLTYLFQYSVSPETPVLTIQSRGPLNNAEADFPAGLESYDFFINLFTRAYDSLGAFSTASTSVEVLFNSNINVSNYLSSRLTDALNSGDTDSAFLTVNNVATTINVLNCTATPTSFCSSLNRQPCSSVPNTCMDCKTGFIGVAGPANTLCLPTSEITGEPGSPCATAENCLFGLCEDNVCTLPIQSCPSDIPDTVCSGHGSCLYRDMSGNVLAAEECTITNLYCQASCECDSGYLGVSCSLNPEERDQRDHDRYLLCDGIVLIRDAANPSPQLLESLAASLLSSYNPSEVFSTTTTDRCNEALETISYLTAVGFIQGASPATSGYLINSISAYVQPANSTDPSGDNSDASFVTTALHNITTGLMDSLTNGQDALSIVSDNLQITVQRSFVTDLFNASLLPPPSSAESQYGVAPSTIQFDPSVAEACANDVNYVPLSIMKWNTNPYANSTDSLSNLLRMTQNRDSSDSDVTAKSGSRRSANHKLRRMLDEAEGEHDESGEGETPAVRGLFAGTRGAVGMRDVVHTNVNRDMHVWGEQHARRRMDALRANPELKRRFLQRRRRLLANDGEMTADLDLSASSLAPRRQFLLESDNTSAPVSGYFITLQFASEQNFNFSISPEDAAKMPPSNFTFPDCSYHTGDEYVPCGGCNISSYTNFNVTYLCTDPSQICTVSSSLARTPASLSSSGRLLRSSSRRGMAQGGAEDGQSFDLWAEQPAAEEEESSGGSTSTVSQYAALFTAVAGVLQSVLSQNPFAIDIEQAKVILSFTLSLLVVCVGGSLYFHSWDKQDRNQLIYVQQWPPKDTKGAKRAPNKLLRKFFLGEKLPESPPPNPKSLSKARSTKARSTKTATAVAIPLPASSMQPKLSLSNPKDLASAAAVEDASPTAEASHPAQAPPSSVSESSASGLSENANLVAARSAGQEMKDDVEMVGGGEEMRADELLSTDVDSPVPAVPPGTASIFSLSPMPAPSAQDAAVDLPSTCSKSSSVKQIKSSAPITTAAPVRSVTGFSASTFFDLAMPDVLSKPASYAAATTTTSSSPSPSPSPSSSPPPSGSGSDSFFTTCMVYFSILVERHDFTNMFTKASLALPRMIRFIGLMKSILIGFFIDTVFFSVFFANTGTCESYTNGYDCELSMNGVSGETTCIWEPSEGAMQSSYTVDDVEGACSLRDPPEDLLFVVILALICMIVGVPLDLLFSFILEEYAAKRPDFSTLGISNELLLGRGTKSSDSYVTAAIAEEERKQKRILQAQQQQRQRHQNRELRQQDRTSGANTPKGDDAGDTQSLPSPKAPLFLISPASLQDDYAQKTPAEDELFLHNLLTNKRLSALYKQLVLAERSWPPAMRDTILVNHRQNYSNHVLFRYNSFNRLHDELRFLNVLLKVYQRNYQQVQRFQSSPAASAQARSLVLEETGGLELYAARCEILRKYLHLDMNGRVHKLSFTDIVWHCGSSESKLLSRLRFLKSREQALMDTLEEAELYDEETKEMIVLQFFVLEQFSPFQRYILTNQLFAFDKYSPEVIDWKIWVAAWVFVWGSILFYLYWIMMWGVQSGNALLAAWGINFAIGAIQDIFFVQFFKIITVYIIAIISIRPQLLNLRLLFQNATMAYMAGAFPARKLRRYEYADPQDLATVLNSQTQLSSSTGDLPSATYANLSQMPLIQLVSPVCRVISQSRFSKLGIAKILGNLDDVDIFTMRKTVKSNLFINYYTLSLAFMPFLFFLLLGDTAGGLFLDMLLPTISSFFIVANDMLFQAGGMWLLVGVYVGGFVYICWRRRVVQRSWQGIRRQAAQTLAKWQVGEWDTKRRQPLETEDPDADIADIGVLHTVSTQATFSRQVTSKSISSAADANVEIRLPAGRQQPMLVWLVADVSSRILWPVRVLNAYLLQVHNKMLGIEDPVRVQQTIALQRRWKNLNLPLALQARAPEDGALPSDPNGATTTASSASTETLQTVCPLPNEVLTLRCEHFHPDHLAREYNQYWGLFKGTYLQNYDTDALLRSMTSASSVDDRHTQATLEILVPSGFVNQLLHKHVLHAPSKYDDMSLAEDLVHGRFLTAAAPQAPRPPAGDLSDLSLPRVANEEPSTWEDESAYNALIRFPHAKQFVSQQNTPEGLTRRLMIDLLTAYLQRMEVREREAERMRSLALPSLAANPLETSAKGSGETNGDKDSDAGVESDTSSIASYKYINLTADTIQEDYIDQYLLRTEKLAAAQQETESLHAPLSSFPKPIEPTQRNPLPRWLSAMHGTSSTLQAAEETRPLTYTHGLLRTLNPTLGEENASASSPRTHAETATEIVDHALDLPVVIVDLLVVVRELLRSFPFVAPLKGRGSEGKSASKLIDRVHALDTLTPEEAEECVQQFNLFIHMHRMSKKQSVISVQAVHSFMLKLVLQIQNVVRSQVRKLTQKVVREQNRRRKLQKARSAGGIAVVEDDDEDEEDGEFVLEEEEDEEEDEEEEAEVEEEKETGRRSSVGDGPLSPTSPLAVEGHGREGSVASSHTRNRFSFNVFSRGRSSYSQDPPTSATAGEVPKEKETDGHRQSMEEEQEEGSVTGEGKEEDEDHDETEFGLNLYT